MKKETKSIIFYQDWGTYDPLTLVSVNNKSYEELLEMIDKKTDLGWYEAIKDRLEGDEIMAPLAKNHHFTCWNGPDGIRYSTIFLPEWKWTPHDYTILAHELIHAVSFTMGKMMDLIKENEAMAYQHTFLMRAILERLEKHKGKAILH